MITAFAGVALLRRPLYKPGFRLEYALPESPRRYGFDRMLSDDSRLRTVRRQKDRADGGIQRRRAKTI